MPAAPRPAPRPARAFLCAAAAAACAAAACDTAPSEAANEALGAHVVAGVLRLENRTSEPVHYTAIESELATRVDLAPCRAPTQCPARVAPGAVVAIPLRDVAGWEPGDREAVVYAWHLAPLPSGAEYAQRWLPTLRVRLR